MLKELPAGWACVRACLPDRPDAAHLYIHIACMCLIGFGVGIGVWVWVLSLIHI